ncbi:MAG: hypothetical protein JSV50_08360 [Desulfobacteraceae bacterium]|nr:MAG: hypothetical protein JSV50_08360 [Desulfobacteraceae bacterium]
MKIIQQIDLSDYYEPKSAPISSADEIYPIDDYSEMFNKDIGAQIKELSFKYFFLKIPLLGQYNLKADVSVWCGRASASMVYNYFMLLEGGNPKEKYITHWTGPDKRWFMDLYYPKGERAAHSMPTGSRDKYPDGANPFDTLKRLKYLKERFLFKTAEPNRIEIAAKIALIDEKVFGKLENSGIFESLHNNNPVVIYTGISTTSPNYQHILVIAGYCYLKDADGEKPNLWLLIADPSMPKTSILKQCKKLSDLDSSHEIIVIEGGSWNNSRASLYLLRAAVLFRKHKETNKLYMDGIEHGGKHYVCLNKTPAYRETVEAKKVRIRHGSFLPFPISPEEEEHIQPLRYYYNNECLNTGFGGYYPLGLMKNIHGGIHLFPHKDKGSDKKHTPVKCIAPGYIAAARLWPGSLKDENKKDTPIAKAIKASMNWTGFVLVRHDVQPLKETRAEERDTATNKVVKLKEIENDGKPVAIYSLYMHLTPPKSSIDDSELKDAVSYEDVPWFDYLLRRGYGTWVNICPTEGELGDVHWSAKEIDSDTVSPDILRKKQSFSAKVHGKKPGEKKDISVVDKGTMLRVFKEPAANFSEAIDALKEGKVVTFAEPFFPVSAGDIIGHVKPLPKKLMPQRKVEAKDTTNKDKKTMQSGFLHWEILCSESDNSLLKIADIAEEVLSKGDEGGKGKEASDKEVEGERQGGSGRSHFKIFDDTHPDNYIDWSEVEGQMETFLATEQERKDFKDAMSSRVEGPESEQVAGGRGKGKQNKKFYYPEIVEFFNNKETFVSQEKNDSQTSYDGFMYPVTLRVDTSLLTKPENYSESDVRDRKYFAFYIEFRKKDKRSEKYVKLASVNKSLKIDSKKLQEKPLEFTIQVPVEAEEIVCTPMTHDAGYPLFYLDPAPPAPDSEIEFFKKITSRRFRNTMLTHGFDWSLEAATRLYQRLKEEKLLPAQFNPLEPLTWSSDDVLSVFRFNAKGQKNPVFGNTEGQLPLEGKIQNIHPITCMWLLRILTRHDRIKIKDSPERAVFQPDLTKTFKYWGWVTQNENKEGKVKVLFGDTVYAMVIDDDYAYDTSTTITLKAHSDTGQQLVLGSGLNFPKGSHGNHVLQLNVCFWGTWDFKVYVKAQLLDDPDSKRSPFPTQIITEKPEFFWPFISTADGSGESDEVDSTTRSLLLRDLYNPIRYSDGTFSWLLQFREGKKPMPLSIEGFLVFYLKKNPKEPHSWKPIPKELAAYCTRAAVEPNHQASKLEYVKKENCKIVDDFIIGLSDAKKGKLGSKVTDDFRFSEYRGAYQHFQLACELAEKVQHLYEEYKKQWKVISIYSVSLDGLTCEILCLTKDRRGKPTFQKITDRIISESTVAGITKINSEKGNLIGVKLSVGPSLKSCDECELQTPDKFEYDPTNCFIVGIGAESPSIRVTNDLAYSDFHAKRSIRLYVYLAEAIQKLKKEYGLKKRIDPLEVSEDGLSCIIKQQSAMEAADKTGVFYKVLPVDNHLALSVLPRRNNAMNLTFSPNNALAEIADKQQNLRDEDRIYVKFGFLVINGDRFLEPYQEYDVEMNMISKSAVERMKKQAGVGGTLEYGPSLEAVSMLTNISFSFSEHPFTLLNDGRKCYLVIEVECEGNLDIWQHYNKVLSKEGDPQPVTMQDVPHQRGILQARYEFPKDKGGNVTFTVQARLKPKFEARINYVPSPKSFDYDFTPRFEKPQLTEDSIGKKKYVVISCQTYGIECPKGAGVKDFSIPQTKLTYDKLGRNLHFVILDEMGHLAFAETKGKKDKPKKLTDCIEYLIPGKDSGFCNSQGIFLARIDKVLLSDEKKYTFKAIRYGEIRGKDDIESKPAEWPM